MPELVERPLEEPPYVWSSLRVPYPPAQQRSVLLATRRTITQSRGYSGVAYALRRRTPMVFRPPSACTPHGQPATERRTANRLAFPPCANCQTAEHVTCATRLEG